MIRFPKAALASFALSLAVTATATANPSIYPTGVTRYDPTRAYNSFVLFAGSDGKTHLIDMDGNEVHRWEFSGSPSEILDPKITHGQLGHVIVQVASTNGDGVDLQPGRATRQRNRDIGELDWQGTILWQYGSQAPGGALGQHHDWSKLPNGNLLVLASVNHPLEGFTAPTIKDDVVYEITPDKKIIWTWTSSEHLPELGFTPDTLALLKKTAPSDYLHLNNMTALGPNKWFDAGDTRFNPDNILIDSRNANFLVIIDKKTGNIVYRLGPDLPPSADSAAVGSGNGAGTRGRTSPDGAPGPRIKPPVPRPVDQFSGQHKAHIIPVGLPGAGNILLFDNQGEGGYPPVELGVNSGSRVLEIDPVKKEIVWEYTGLDSGRPAWTFSSTFISSARRLPNGNTLIDEGMNGRFFQITPTGEIVWEYVSPYFTQPRGPEGSVPTISTNQVYRAQPVPYDWVPAETAHAEDPVTPPDLANFHLPSHPAKTAAAENGPSKTPGG